MQQRSPEGRSSRDASSSQDSKMTAIVKSKTNPGGNPRDSLLLAYWLMFLRAPGRNTLPGEPIDLGEIGTVREKSFERPTPYSLAKPRQ
jgi:hypothetical protein